MRGETSSSSAISDGPPPRGAKITCATPPTSPTARRGLHSVTGERILVPAHVRRGYTISGKSSCLNRVLTIAMQGNPATRPRRPKTAPSIARPPWRVSRRASPRGCGLHRQRGDQMRGGKLNALRAPVVSFKTRSAKPHSRPVSGARHPIRARLRGDTARPGPARAPVQHLRLNVQRLEMIFVNKL